MKKIKKISIVAILMLAFALSLAACSLKVTEISVSKMPDVLVYTVGDTLIKDGGELSVKISKEADNKTVKLNDPAVTCSPITLETAGEKVKITVTYENKTTSFNVKVLPAIDGISIAAKPINTDYIAGQKLDLTGGKIKIAYTGGKTEVIDMSDGRFVVSPVNLNTAGIVPIFVSLEDRPNIGTSFNVNVADCVIVSMHQHDAPFRLLFSAFEDLDLTGGTVELIYNNQTQNKIVQMTDFSIFTVSGFAGTPGVNHVKLSLKSDTSKFITIQVAVADTEIQSMVIIKPITKIEYLVGEPLDLKGGIIEITYRTGDSVNKVSKSMANTDMFTYSGFDSSEWGLKEVTVRLNIMKPDVEPVEVTFVVVIWEDEILSMSLSNAPTKTNYYRYETFNPAGGRVMLNYANGRTEEISLSDSRLEIKGINNSEPTATVNSHATVNVILKDNISIFTSFQIRVVNNNPVSLTIIQNPTKRTYKWGESLLLNGGIVKLTYDEPQNKPVERIFDMDSPEFTENFGVSGFNSFITPGQSGTQIITVFMLEKNDLKATFSVNVEYKTVK